MIPRCLCVFVQFRRSWQSKRGIDPLTLRIRGDLRTVLNRNEKSGQQSQAARVQPLFLPKAKTAWMHGSTARISLAVSLEALHAREADSLQMC